MYPLVILLLCSVVSGQTTLHPAGPVACPTTSPCVCNAAGIIDCANKDLNVIPTFTTSQIKFAVLFLGQNNISHVSSNAFANLNVSEIYLEDNTIADFPDDAFTDVENVVTRLVLRNNELTRIPTAVGRLNKLINLDVRENAIGEAGYGNAVLTDIGDTLTELHMGDEAFLANWPLSLHHLQALETLHVFGGQFPFLPPDGFVGFERTLRKLVIENSTLLSLPLAISRLHNLIELSIDSNHNIGDHGFILQPFARASETLKVLSLKDNRLTTLPKMLPQLRSLKSLDLSNNHLDYISDEAVQIVPKNLTELILHSCGLDRLPSAIDSLTSLESLDLSDNNIVTFERYDLANLDRLRKLTLADNPLSYISGYALGNLASLRSLSLAETRFEQLPRVLTNLDSLLQLDVTHTPYGVECNCNLVWMKALVARPGFSVTGRCETVQFSVQEYLTNQQGLLGCPGYNNA